MFPNVRLLIGTLFIALLVLSCEFGVFAALRVNREPLNRLTAESAPLQLAAGQNAPLAVATSWAVSRDSRVSAADGAPAQRVIETPAPATGGATDALGNEVTAAVAQPALTPAPAAAAVQQAPAPPAPPAASAAPAQGAAPAQSAQAPAAAEAHGPELAAAPPSLTAAPAQPTPAPAANAAAQVLQPAQPAPDPQAHVSVANTDEPASGAPVAAPPPAAAPAPAAQPAEITGSISNVATPDPALPEAETPLPKPAPKIAHKPVNKAAKAVQKPAQLHIVKKRVVRRTRAPAAASSAQPANTFDNSVFQTAPQIQKPAKKRPATKKAATDNTFGNSFGTQFGAH